MKHPFTLLLFLLALGTTAVGQTASQSTQYYLGYYGQFGITPGTRVGADIPLKSWEKENSKGTTRYSSLVVSPSLGYFSNRNNHNSLLGNVELGLKTQRQDSPWWSMVSLGSGYLARYQVTANTVNLQGEITGREHERIDYLMPSLNFAVGHAFSNKLGGYAKLGLGTRRLLQSNSTNPSNSAMYMLELGIRFSPSGSAPATK